MHAAFGCIHDIDTWGGDGIPSLRSARHTMQPVPADRWQRNSVAGLPNKTQAGSVRRGRNGAKRNQFEIIVFVFCIKTFRSDECLKEFKNDDLNEANMHPYIKQTGTHNT